MNREIWKQNLTDPSVGKENFIKYQKELGFHIMEDHKNISKIKVQGRCLTTGCENNYEKEFRAMVLAPFCAKCMGHKPKRLFVEEYPEIVKKIIRSVKPIDTLTIGMNIKITLKCDEKCSRCYKQHEYDLCLAKIDKYNKECKCLMCLGRTKCSCQKDDEFRCYECKLIKPLTERCSHSNLCRACKRVIFEKNAETFMRRLWRVACDLMKKKERKQGDLTFEYLLHLYEEQQRRCYISNVPLVCKSHSDWKASIERLDNSVGYDNKNVKLIICELQSTDIRQWTIERWDEVCSMTLGALENIPDESELLAKQVELAKTRNVIIPRMIRSQKTEINDQGLIKCKKCLCWLDNTKISPKHKGFCKKCISEDISKSKNTLRNILKICLSGSKTHAKERHDVHEITFEDLLNQYSIQGGRCYYSYVPLAFDGVYQMSIDRINVRLGYTKDNIVLVIHALNVGDWSRNKHADDDRNGSSGWNREKFLWAVRQNSRGIIHKPSYIKDVYENSTPILPSSIEQKTMLLLEYYDKHNTFPNTQYVDPNGIKLGRFINSIKSCPSYNLSDRLKQLILDKDPKFFEIFTTDMKFERLLKYYQEHKRWPFAVCVDGDFSIGYFCSSARNNKIKVSEDIRHRLLEIDPNFFKK